MKNKSNAISICLLLAVALGASIILWPQSGLGQQISTPEPNVVDENEPPTMAEPAVTTEPTATVGPATAVQNSWSRYQIILQRNIFSRQRGPIRQRRARNRAIVTRNPESYLVLKGLVQEDDTFIAFVENTQNNTVLTLREGDSIARGTVKKFTLDSIEYYLEGKAINVTLGRDLEGEQGTLSMNRLMELSATSAPVSDPNAPSDEAPPSDEEAEILKKLMEQRRQQLGQ
jgi:hypothetical protein